MSQVEPTKVAADSPITSRDLETDRVIPEAAAEQEQHASRRLNALLSHLPSVILYETGAAGEFVSDGVRSLLGYEPEEITTDRTFFPRKIHPDDWQRLDRQLIDWRESGRKEVLTSQFRVKRKDGDYVWLEDQISWVEHEDGLGSIIGVMIDITAQRNALTKTNDANERFRVFMDHFPGIATIRDPDGKYLYANKAFSELLTLPISEILGKQSNELFGEAIAYILEIQTGLAEAGATPSESLEELNLGRGTEQWLTRRFLLDGGEDVGFGANQLVGEISLNMTKERKAEAALRDSEEQLRSVLEASPDIIAILEVDGRVRFANRALELLLGIAPNTVIGLNPINLVHPDDRAQAVSLFRRAFASSNAAQGIFRMQHKDGRYLYFEGGTQSVNHPSMNTNPNNSKRGLLIIVGRDVSDRIHAERELSHTQKQSQAIVNAANGAGLGLAIIKKSDDGRPFVSFINDAGAAIHGSSPNEIIGGYDMATFSDETRNQLLAHWKSFVEHGTIPKSLSASLIHANGHLVPITVGLTLTELDEAPSIIAFFNDISEQKATESQLIESKGRAEELSRIKSNILANFSHELRTPLHAILGFSSLLSDELADQEMQQYADSIQRSGRRLLETLSSILELAMLESDTSDMTLYPTLLCEVLTEIKHASEARARDLGLKLELEFESEDIAAMLDTTRFRTAMDKVVSNAFKFTRKGTVTLVLQRVAQPTRTGHKQERAVIRVRDTGIGMSKKFLSLAFDEFTQESVGINRSFEGTGLGLTLARSYVRLMNGEMTIDSEPEKGTEVSISFPLIPMIG